LVVKVLPACRLSALFVFAGLVVVVLLGGSVLERGMKSCFCFGVGGVLFCLCNVQLMRFMRLGCQGFA